MLQYKIPQNVQVEDKIVAFLTLRQLIICGLGGGIAYLLYITLQPNYYFEVWLPPVAIISLLTIAIAFVKINNNTFTKWVLLLIEFLANPRKRMWNKEPSTTLLFKFLGSSKSSSSKQKAQKKNEQAAKEADEQEVLKNLSNLSALAEKVDHNPFAQESKKAEAAASQEEAARRQKLEAIIQEQKQSPK
jgi:hypothetical protein